MPNVASQPSQPKVSRRLGRGLRACESGDLDAAERLFNAVLAHRPDDFDALHGLGQIHYRRGRLGTALVLTQTALRAAPGRADGFSSLGLLFHGLRRFDEALASYDEALRLGAADAELFSRRGVALLELRRPCEALASLEDALSRDAEHLDALGNLGNALLKLNRPEEAIAAYDRALRHVPENAQLLTNRAVALRRLDRPREALMSASRAVAARPDFAQARFVESLVRLTLGDLDAGWDGYEARWGVGALAQQRRTFTAPLWQGREPLDGKTILLHAEQGFGDTIQFVRYAPLVARRGAIVILEVQRALVPLLAGTPGIAAIIARGETLPAFDFHCPLLSLPRAFATRVTTIPADIPYVAPTQRAVAAWRQRLPRGRPLVGLAWSGERSHDNDPNRSIPLESLAPLLAAPHVQFVSVQHDVREEDAEYLRSLSAVIHIGQEFSDFADTAAALAALDVVVAVDTAVAHLAGALAKPLYLLLPFAADFRWLRERADSPWYPSARLVRQPRFGDWDSVIAALGAELSRLGRPCETAASA